MERTETAPDFIEDYGMQAEALLLELMEIKLPLDVFKTASQEDDGWFVTKS